MLYVGLIFAGIAVWYYISEAVRSIRWKSDEYSDVCAFLLHVRGALSSGGGTLCEITKGFSSEILEKNNFLPCLRADSASLHRERAKSTEENAFFRDKLSKITFALDKEDAQRLIFYIEGFGKNYLEEEKKKLNEIIDFFKGREKDVSEKGEKSIKVTMILFVFFFIGAFILLL